MQKNAEEEQACKRKLRLCRRQAEFEGLFGYLGWDGQAFWNIATTTTTTTG